MKKLLTACMWLALSAPALAQDTVTSTILHRDSLFWQAYNRCDVSAFRSFFTNDIEFYHDKGGATFGLDSLVASMRNNLCKDPATYHLRREVVPGSVHVYPLSRAGAVYGAVIEGEHVFYINQAGKSEFLDGQARFTHLWLLQNGEWRMARVLSYNHHAAEYQNKRVAIAVSASTLQSHVGKYKGPQSDVSVSVAEGHLVLTMGDKQFALYPETADRYFMNERDLTFTFGGGKLVVREHGAVAEELSYIRE